MLEPALEGPPAVAQRLCAVGVEPGDEVVESSAAEDSFERLRIRRHLRVLASELGRYLDVELQPQAVAKSM